MILGIETASADASVAIARTDGTPIAVDGQAGDPRQNANARLLPRILALLAANGGGLWDLERVAVGSGPGSFTGLRVGMSLAKGLARALSIPIVAVPSLDAWLAADPEASAALCRAGAHEAHLLVRDSSEVVVVAPQMAVDMIGERRVAAPTELAAAFGLPAAVPPLAAAAAVCRLGAASSPADLATLEPAYGRPPRGLDEKPHGAVRCL